MLRNTIFFSAWSILRYKMLLSNLKTAFRIVIGLLFMGSDKYRLFGKTRYKLVLNQLWFINKLESVAPDSTKTWSSGDIPVGTRGFLSLVISNTIRTRRSDIFSSFWTFRIFSAVLGWHNVAGCLKFRRRDQSASVLYRLHQVYGLHLILHQNVAT